MTPLLGEAPPTLLHRCFEKREHAEAFLSGHIWMRNLSHYRKMNGDPREDASEQEIHLAYPSAVRRVGWEIKTGVTSELPAEPGLMHVSGEDVTPSYVLCCVGEEAELGLAVKQYGSFVVRLNDPKAFIARLSKAIEKIAGRLGPLECGRIVYADSVRLDSSPEAADYVTQSCFTKSISYRVDFEYRMLQRMELHLGGERKYLEVELGSPIEYADLIAMEGTSE